jgi:Protein of unknown function (DUF1810)
MLPGFAAPRRREIDVCAGLLVCRSHALPAVNPSADASLASESESEPERMATVAQARRIARRLIRDARVRLHGGVSQGRRGLCLRRENPRAARQGPSLGTAGRFGEWRDPDSNRGHHDFQSRATGPIRRADRSEKVRGAAHSGSMSRRLAAIPSPTDAVKLRSSMTLFATADPYEPLFRQVLDRYFDGATDAATEQRL